ncbi:hypothetical protein BASA81_001680 [Batrachochytrium salamandrivorans]|nr:hypothetical protein BASA81_001680 [Batrachochytrium salamandrivorans]
MSDDPQGDAALPQGEAASSQGDAALPQGEATPSQVVTVLGYSRPVIELVARVIKDTYELPVETRQIQLGSIEAVNLKLDPRSSLVVYCPRREGNSFVLLDTILRPLRGDCPSAMSEEEWRARKLGSLKTSRMDNAYFGVITLLDRRLAFALVDDTATHGMCPSNDDNLVAKKLESLRDNLIRDLQYHGLFNSTDANYTPIVLSLDSSCDKLNKIQAQAIRHELDAVRRPRGLTMSQRDWFSKPNQYGNTGVMLPNEPIQPSDPLVLVLGPSSSQVVVTPKFKNNKLTPACSPNCSLVDKDHLLKVLTGFQNPTPIPPHIILFVISCATTSDAKALGMAKFVSEVASAQGSKVMLLVVEPRTNETEDMILSFSEALGIESKDTAFCKVESTGKPTFEFTITKLEDTESALQSRLIISSAWCQSQVTRRNKDATSLICERVRQMYLSPSEDNCESLGA